MDATIKLNNINQLIDNGYTVVFSTQTKAIAIDQSVVNKFKTAGYDMLAVANNSLYIRDGKRMVCADYCRITYYTAV